MFCTFSSAETQWTHLLKILGKLVDKKECNDDQLENLNWEEKCRLIQSDSVTCARHFDYQISQFINHFLISEVEPLGNIGDWFYSIDSIGVDWSGVLTEGLTSYPYANMAGRCTSICN